MGNTVTCNKCNAPFKDSMSCRIHCVNKDTNICYNCDRNLSEYHGNCYHSVKSPHKKSIFGSCMRRKCNEEYVLTNNSFTLDGNMVTQKNKIQLNVKKIQKYNREDILILDNEELESLFDTSESNISNSTIKSDISDVSDVPNEIDRETNDVANTINKKPKNTLMRQMLKNLDEDIKKQILKKAKDDMSVNYGTIKNKPKLKHKISI